ncbi:hypothetical protein ACE1CM_40120 [Microseira sp. BLCC-F43]
MPSQAKQPFYHPRRSLRSHTLPPSTLSQGCAAALLTKILNL